MLYNFGMLFLLNLVEVEVHGLLDIGDGYIIVLSDKSQMKFLTMTIGKNEGDAIIIAKENIETPRPLTHELTTNIIKNLDGNIEYIEIYDLKEGVYYAKIHLTKKFLFFKDERIIDSRPSDAIALALRFKSKIYVSEKLLENVEIPKPKKKKKFYDI
jgi:bifunctional DNase/RNase